MIVVKDQCEKLPTASTVALRNCKVVMRQGYMRIAVDKWGAIKPSNDEIPSEPNTEKNFSDIKYEIMSDKN